MDFLATSPLALTYGGLDMDSVMSRLKNFHCVRATIEQFLFDKMISGIVTSTKFATFLGAERRAPSLPQSAPEGVTEGEELSKVVHVVCVV